MTSKYLILQKVNLMQSYKVLPYLNVITSYYDKGNY